MALTYRATTFVEELELLTNRYSSTARFSGAVGLSYSYIPKVNYRTNSNIGFSHLQTAVSGGDDLLSYTQEFNNKEIIAPTIRADTEYFTIQFQLPSFKESKTEKLNVTQRKVSGVEGDIFYNSSITSELSIQYDMNLSTSLKDRYIRISDSKYKGFILGPQSDISLGLGAIGANVKNTFTHNVRVRSVGDTTSSFSSLANTEIQETTTSDSFFLPYAMLSLDFTLNDQMKTGITGKYFFESGVDDKALDVDGFTFGLEFSFYIL